MTEVAMVLNSNPSITFNRQVFRSYTQTISNIEIYRATITEYLAQVFTVIPPTNATTITTIELLMPTDLIDTVNVSIVGPNTRIPVHQYTGKFLGDMVSTMRGRSSNDFMDSYTFLHRPPEVGIASVFARSVGNNICHFPRLPSCSFVVSKLAQVGHWIEVEVKFNESYYEIAKLRVSYGYALCEAEQNRFRDISIDDVFMRFGHIPFSLSAGTNVIPLPRVNASIFFFHCDQTLNGVIDTDNVSYPQFRIDPERSQGRIGFEPSTYIVDVYDNMCLIYGNLHHPSGNILLGAEAKVIFNMESPANLSIVYGYTDILHYDQSIFFSEHRTVEEVRALRSEPELERMPYALRRQDPELETELHAIESESESESEDGAEAEVEAEVQAEVQTGIEAANLSGDVAEEIELANMVPSRYFINLFIQYERSTAKPMTPSDSCLISLEEIKVGEYFYTCETCGKPFLSKLLKKWIAGGNSTCPHCRTDINHYPQLYYRPEDRRMWCCVQ